MTSDLKSLAATESGAPRATADRYSREQRQAIADFVRSLEAGEIRTTEIERCVCGGEDLESLEDRDRFSLPFSSIRCRACGLVLTSPAIAEESVGYYYAEHYLPLHGTIESQERVSMALAGRGKEIYGQLKNHLPDLFELRLLHVGGGTGSVALEFLVAARPDGLRTEPTILEYIPRIPVGLEAARDLEFVIGGLEDLKSSDPMPFDVVILSRVLEHVTDIESQLACLRGCIHEKTLIYVEAPGVCLEDEEKCDDECDEDFEISPFGAHGHRFSLNALTAAMEKLGHELLWGNEKVEAVFRLVESGSRSAD